eukprot:TRINITY_DN17205_c0_g1_i1.p1 TRINITY_DN17205_c0_g1~~TRINITY_DN17205_c0_g1_i1.p1  ORF type:complete len:162 (+),score=4.09 TRINITY_DN17205_c0_g1_i1:68-553(+)
MIRRPPRSTLSSSSAASDVYKRQVQPGRVGQGCPVILTSRSSKLASNTRFAGPAHRPPSLQLPLGAASSFMTTPPAQTNHAGAQVRPATARCLRSAQSWTQGLASSSDAEGMTPRRRSALQCRTPRSPEARCPWATTPRQPKPRISSKLSVYGAQYYVLSS